MVEGFQNKVIVYSFGFIIIFSTGTFMAPSQQQVNGRTWVGICLCCAILENHSLRGRQVCHKGNPVIRWMYMISSDLLINDDNMEYSHLRWWFNSCFGSQECSLLLILNQFLFIFTLFFAMRIITTSVNIIGDRWITGANRTRSGLETVYWKAPQGQYKLNRTSSD